MRKQVVTLLAALLACLLLLGTGALAEALEAEAVFAEPLDEQVTMAAEGDEVYAEPVDASAEGEELDLGDFLPDEEAEGAELPTAVKPAEECAHTNTYSYDDWTYEYEPIDNREHTTIEYKVKRTFCDDCGEELPSTKEEIDRWTSSHDYNANGVCESCNHKNTCQHANTDTYGEWNDTKYDEIAGDNRYHTMSGEKFTVTRCEDCGNEISRVSNGKQTEKEEHNYNDQGVCNNCGHVNACKHTNTYEDKSWDWETFRYEEIPGDNLYHNEKGTRVTHTWCRDCGQRIKSTRGNEETEKGEHYYNADGICNNCKHVNTCKHANTYTDDNWDWNTVKEVEIAGDNRYHTRSGERVLVTRCSDCGMTIKREPNGKASEKTEHYYRTDGTCEECGHVNTCKHPTTREYDNWDWNTVQYKEIAGDNHYHMMSGEKLKVVQCADCRMDLSSKSKGQCSEKETHYYRNGICADCNHKNTCKHTNTWIEYDWDEKAVFEKIDTNFHKATGTLYENTWCDDCGERVKQTSLGKRTVKTMHSYTEGGKCWQCNFYNPCKHAHKDTYTSFDDGAKYTSVNNATHKITGQAVEVTYCLDCGQNLGEKAVGVRTEEWSHNYENGVCRNCNHKNTCKHKKTTKDTYFNTNVSNYKKIDSKTHEVTGPQFEQVFCQDCWTTLSRKPLGIKTVRENHSYHNGGICYCGATSKVTYLRWNYTEKMGVGNTWNLDVTGYTAANKKATIKVTYKTSDKKILTVSSKGVITAIKAGKATVSFEAANGLNGKLEIQVLKQPSSFKLSVTKKTLTLQNSGTVGFQLTGKFAKNTFTTLSFTTSDKNVAKVDKQTGYVTAVGEGVCTITAKDKNGNEAKCTVTVKDPNAPTKITLKQGNKTIGKTATVKVGKTLKLKVVFTPKGSTSKLTWTSKDPKIAKVKNGVVTGVKAGKTTITVSTKGGVKKSFTITVKK